MLLNRRRIDKWARWVAIGLAAVFALSFAFMGVGTGVDMNWSSLWSDGSSSGNGGRTTGDVQTPEDLIKGYEAELAANPDNYEALVGIATQYEALDQSDLAAEYLQKAIALRPEDGPLHQRLAAIYMHPATSNYEAAVPVLNQLTSLEPENAQAFLLLGVAQRELGNAEAAALAWNKYLELEPEGASADDVRGQMETLTQAPAEGAAPAAGSTSPETTAP